MLKTFVPVRITMCMLLLLSATGCDQEIHPDRLGICKEETHKLKLLYVDSKGIYKVETSVVSDTLVLDVKASHNAKQDFFDVTMPDNVKYVRYGNVIKAIVQLPVCTQPFSGEAAKAYLKQKRINK